jgi:predicted nuclease of restriction endonuclease-like (RecB) superfamily
MKHTNLITNKCVKEIQQILETARSNAYRAVNFAMVKAYWEIGRIIVEEEQKGEKRAEYGIALINELSKKLTEEYGKGFTKTNLKYMRTFYQKFKKGHALRAELSWTHYRLFLRIEEENARQFYLNETINSNWSTRELDRQINSLLYERLALSKDKKGVLELAEKGQIIKNPEDLIKDPYVLEFLNLKENSKFQEKDVESLLIDNLKQFILELGKGFSFVSRQKRISIDNEHYYVDLVFYNYYLKCFVLIDLKIGKLTHKDIGQMDFYVRYFEKEIKSNDDNPTIGLILCSDKSKTMIKYTLLDESKQLFASKYKLYLPTEKELREEIEKRKEQIQINKKLGE